MSENQQPNHDLLEEAVHAFQWMSVPERPSDAEVLSQFGTRQGDLSQPSRIPLPSQRRFRMHVMVSSAAAAVLLSVGLALFLRNSSPPEPARVAATDPADQAGAVAGEPPRGENLVVLEVTESKSTLDHSALGDPPQGENRLQAVLRDAAVDSPENRVKESQVIVVATARSSAPAPPEVPGDAPEVFIQFRVKRILKGELAATVVTTRTSVAADVFIGKDWIVWLSPEHLAGKHQYGHISTADFEPKLKEILAEDKK